MLCEEGDDGRELEEVEIGKELIDGHVEPHEGLGSLHPRLQRQLPPPKGPQEVSRSLPEFPLPDLPRVR